MIDGLLPHWGFIAFAAMIINFFGLYKLYFLNIIDWRKEKKSFRKELDSVFDFRIYLCKTCLGSNFFSIIISHENRYSTKNYFRALNIHSWLHFIIIIFDDSFSVGILVDLFHIDPWLCLSPLLSPLESHFWSLFRGRRRSSRCKK